MILEQRFRDNVAAALEAKGWTQSDLAREMHVGRQYVYKYLRSGVSPGLNVIERFATALDVNPLTLLDERPVEALAG